MIAVILAGGSGTRFWPVSRRSRPKQLVALYGGKPMIAHTVDRVRGHVGDDKVLIVCGEELLEATRAAVPGLPASSFLAEPVPRNTAPAIGLAAAIAQARWGDAVLAVLPSDHYIRDESAFRERLVDAEQAALAGHIVTLGIEPTGPETGYGYIRHSADSALPRPARRVEAFVEKPDLQTAISYLESGHYLWNAGIFVFRPDVILAEIERQMPAMATGLGRIADTWGSDSFQVTLSREFPALQSISIDYGVMENAESVAVVPADVGWSDVGHWAAVDSILPPDDSGNHVVGESVVLETHNSVVFNSTAAAITAVVGLEDTIVVHTDDAVLVLPRDRAQDVRAIVEELHRRGLDHA